MIRPHFRANVAAELKSDRSPVTIADHQAERAIRAVLAARFPDHPVFGEEFGGATPGEGPCWVIDPIDGTRAFITGRPVFGTLIALLDGPIPVLGLIDQPVTGERWLGAAGMATRFTGPFGGTPRCRPCRSLAEAELSTTAPDTFPDGARAGWERLAASARRVSWGGDCYAYGLLALGQIDVIAESGLKLWDWAALLPVIEGAGGALTDWDGRAPRPDGAGDILAVGDRALIAEAVRKLSA